MNNNAVPLPSGPPAQPADWRTVATYIAPLVVLLGLASLLPWPETDAETAMSQTDQQRMVVLLAVQAGLTAVALAWWFWRCGRDFSWRISPAAFLLGGIGVVLWILLAQLDEWVVRQLGLQWLVPKRTALDPWQQFSDGTVRNLFLAVRFALLAVLVPLAEEIFVRGWLGRWFDSEPVWHRMSLSQIGRDGLVAIAVYAVLAHPMEALAATVWFNMVSWHMKRSGSLADCIVIHATTNLLLGLYVVQSGNWQLW